MNERLADLEHLFGKGLLRKHVLINQRIEKATRSGESYRDWRAKRANLRQTMGDLDVKIGELKASYQRQTLSELQETSQRLTRDRGNHRYGAQATGSKSGIREYSQRRARLHYPHQSHHE